MKITIAINDIETKGIKAYLKDTGNATDKKAIADYIAGIVIGTIHAPQEAVSEYIKNVK